MSSETELDGKERTGPGAPGRRTLSREQIIETAIDFVDKRGLTALTMRRLGKELRVEAMSLYRYVNGREDLLEGIVDHMVAELHLCPDDEHLQPTNGWQAYLVWLAHGVRALAREHPNVFPLIATRHPAAPWLRPPLRSLRVVEDFLTMLISRGFSDTRAVQAYRAFSSFLLGHLLLEVAQQGVPITALDDPEGAPDAEERSLADFPLVRRLAPLLSEDESAAEFEESLENLLERLQRVLRESRRPGSTT